MDEELLFAAEQQAPLFARADPQSVEPLHLVLSQLLQRSAEPEGRESLGAFLGVERLASLIPNLSQPCAALRGTLRGDEEGPPPSRPLPLPSVPESPASLEPLLLLLRILRNLCAGMAPNQDAFLFCGAHDAVATMADRLITAHVHSMAGGRTEGGEGVGGAADGSHGRLPDAGVPSKDLLQQVESLSLGGGDAAAASTRASSAQGASSSPLAEGGAFLSSSSAPVPRPSRSSLFARRSLSSAKLAGVPLTLAISSANPNGAFSASNPAPLSPFAAQQSPAPSPLPSASKGPTAPQLPVLPAAITPPQHIVDTLRAILQLLGNCCSGSPVNQSAVWERCFPGTLLRLAAVRSLEVQGPLCMVVYTCCRDDSKRAQDLMRKVEGVFLFSAVLAASSAAALTSSDGGAESSDTNLQQENEWLEFLVEYTCVRKGYLPSLFPRLTSARLLQDKVNESREFCAEQAALLACMRTSLSQQQWKGVELREKQPQLDSANDGKEEGGGGPIVSSVEPWSETLQVETLTFLHSTAKLAALEVGKQSPLEEQGGIPGRVLRSTLGLLREVCVKLNSDAGEAGYATSSLQGVVSLALDLLRNLPPPTGSGLSSEPSGPFPKTSFYIGYRRDLVAIIANASYRQKAVQDLVRESGSLLLVLQQCVRDEPNPYLREWAFFAVRNLLEGNEANQKELSELEVQGGAEVPELSALGLKVEVDSQTGRPKLVNTAS